MLLSATVSLATLILANGAHVLPEEVSAFTGVKNFFGVRHGSLPRQETMLLIRHVLYRLKCDKIGVDCLKCLPVDSVLEYLGRSRESSLDEISFNKFSAVLVVFMKDIKGECEHSGQSIGRQEMSFIDALMKLSGNELKLSVDSLADILQQINKNYRFGSQVLDRKGEILLERSEVVDFQTDFRCFSPMSLYTQLGKSNDDELSASELQTLTGFIVLHVLKGHCISVDDGPSPYAFVDSLLSKFGNGSKVILDHEEFENLLEALNIGSMNHDDPRPTSLTKRDLQTILTGSKKEDTPQSLIGAPIDPTLAICLQDHCYHAAGSLRAISSNISAFLNLTDAQGACPVLTRTFLSLLWHDDGDHDDEVPTFTEAFEFGAAAIGFISICSVVGLIILRVSQDRINSYVGCFLLALTVATLIGSAVLHLLPQAIGLRISGEGGVLDGVPLRQSFVKMAVVLTTFYVFIVFNMARSVMTRHQRYDLSSGQTGNSLNPGSTGKDGNGSLTVLILGHAMNNLFSGIAVGAAFTAGVSTGISASIAIFCLEMTQTLGNFSALIEIGVTTKKGSFVAILSMVAAFGGVSIGIPLSGKTGSQEWFLAIIGGAFLYVALANTVPGIIQQLSSCGWVLTAFVITNLGLLCGFAVIFVIAVYGEHITTL